MAQCNRWMCGCAVCHIFRRIQSSVRASDGPKHPTAAATKRRTSNSGRFRDDSGVCVGVVPSHTAAVHAAHHGAQTGGVQASPEPYGADTHPQPYVYCGRGGTCFGRVWREFRVLGCVLHTSAAYSTVTHCRAETIGMWALCAAYGPDNGGWVHLHVSVVGAKAALLRP